MERCACRSEFYWSANWIVDYFEVFEMKKGIAILICPMFSTPCKHCSEEHTMHPHTTLVKDITTKLFKPGKNGNTITSLGFYCNDAGKYIVDMQYCPVRWSQSNYLEVPSVKTMKRKKNTQQTLRM
jgi:hypothetical protein